LQVFLKISLFSRGCTDSNNQESKVASLIVTNMAMAALTKVKSKIKT